MTDASAVKDIARKAIDAASATLFDISERMHAEVELAFEEWKAQVWQCAALKAAGFTAEEGLGSLKTAFRATVRRAAAADRVVAVELVIDDGEHRPRIVGVESVACGEVDAARRLHRVGRVIAFVEVGRVVAEEVHGLLAFEVRQAQDLTFTHDAGPG